MNHHGSSSASQPRSLKLYVTAVTCCAAAVILATFLHASRSVFIGAKPAAVVIFAVLLVVGEARPLKWPAKEPPRSSCISTDRRSTPPPARSS